MKLTLCDVVEEDCCVPLQLSGSRRRPLLCASGIRGEVGDVLVGVTSIFASGARARVKSFIFDCFHHGRAP